MIHAARCLSSFVIALCLTTLTTAQQNPPSTPVSPKDQAALQLLAEEFFATYLREDMNGMIRLWSAGAPEFPAFKQRLQQQFADWDRIEAKGVTVRSQAVTGDRAKLRVEIELAAVDAKTGKAVAGLGKLVRVIECIREESGWKVWAAPTAEAFANVLLAARSEAERAALLSENPDLVNSDLLVTLGVPGERLRVQGNYALAIRHYELALEVNKRLGGQQTEAGLIETEASLLGSIGRCHQDQGNYDSALEYHHRSLNLRQDIGNKVGIALVYHNLGVVHRLLGNFDVALDYYQKCLNLRYELGNKVSKDSIASTLSNLGVVYNQIGNYQLALEHYQKALPMRKAAGDKAGQATTLNNIGTLYSRQRNFPLSLMYQQQSLALHEEIGNQSDIALSLHNIGSTLREAGRYDEALDSFQKSLAVAEKINNRRRIIEALNRIGYLQQFKGDYEAAIKTFQRSLPMAEAAEAKVEVIGTLIHLSDIDGARKNYTSMLDYARRAADLARQSNARLLLTLALPRVSKAHVELGQPSLAQAALEEAIAVTEDLRTQVAGGVSEQQRSFEDKVAPYHQMVHLMVRQNRVGEALNYAERTKSRALLDVLTNGQMNIAKAMSVSEREQEQKLKNNLAQRGLQLARARQSSQPNQSQIADLDGKLQKARLDYETFEVGLYAAHPELKVRRGEAQPITTKEAARLLPNATTALLEYVVTEEKTFLFVLIKNRKVQVYPLGITAKDLDARAEAFRQQLAKRDPEFGAAARELYDLLLKPAAAQLRGKTALVIVPDGPLWSLPFQTLRPAPNRYLIERQAISYAPSLTVLREMAKARNKRPTRPATLLAFGNPALGQATVERAKLTLLDEKFEPLPDAEEQVKKLASIYGPRRSNIYIGAEAREELAKAEAAQHRILHLATHGVLNDASPMYSHLLLAQTEGEAKEAKEDGLLEAWELMKLDLNADLVVLSACETARGRVGAGEGVIGLTWALFVAGCPRTVVSQWKVESASTTELMVEFHRQFKARMQNPKSSLGAAQALRVASLKMLRGGKYRHPFWWAGFVVVGDGF